MTDHSEYPNTTWVIKTLCEVATTAGGDQTFRSRNAHPEDVANAMSMAIESAAKLITILHFADALADEVYDR